MCYADYHQYTQLCNAIYLRRFITLPQKGYQYIRSPSGEASDNTVGLNFYFPRDSASSSPSSSAPDTSHGNRGDRYICTALGNLSSPMFASVLVPCLSKFLYPHLCYLFSASLFYLSFKRCVYPV